MSSARAQTRTARSAVERANHAITIPNGEFNYTCTKITKTMKNITISDLVCYTSETPNLSSELKTANVLLTGNRKQTAGYTFLLRTRKGIKCIFRAASEEDRMDWVQTLQTVCESTWIFPGRCCNLLHLELDIGNYCMQVENFHKEIHQCLCYEHSAQINIWGSVF